MSEGRETYTAEEALRLLAVNTEEPETVEEGKDDGGGLRIRMGRTVHSFVNPAGMLIGADWDYERVRRLIEERAPGGHVSPAGSVAAAMKHGVAVLREDGRPIWFETKEPEPEPAQEDFSDEPYRYRLVQKEENGTTWECDAELIPELATSNPCKNNAPWRCERLKGRALVWVCNVHKSLMMQVGLLPIRTPGVDSK